MTREQEILLKMKKKALSAIRWVKTECNQYGKPTLDYDSGLKVIEHLKKMPSELPSAEARWIPCSERLPSVSGTYIVTTAKGAVCLDHFYADSHEPHWSYWRTRTTLCWMPLPKPYREENEVEE